ncbi:hypothetical protein FJZ22_00820 [Candidatus Pacearchaeota archaeon]|nr:hypothetical protein [Candidatus Pacearchaeota archaeon]
MDKALEEVVEGGNRLGNLGTNQYRASSAHYTAFAEMYLEKQPNVTAGLTCSICTFRGIPTIDDW